MWEYLGQQRPGYRAQRHRIHRDSGYYQGYHQHARHAHKVTGAKRKVNQPQSASANQDEGTAAPLLDGIECHKGKHHVGDTCDDDIDKHTIHIEACTHKNLLSVVENHVGAAPLLEYGYNQTQQQNLAIFLLEQFAQTSLALQRAISFALL